jgi:hypothetical protein
MRADSHYIDQLESRTEGPAIRLIPARQIENSDPLSSIPLEPLAESIAAHGILQPLLVRRHNGRYQLITGRKRLAAAIAAGVSVVPCLMYDIDETDAAALAQADNLRVQADATADRPGDVPAEVPADQSQLVAGGDGLRQTLQMLSAELASIASLTARIDDLIQAQSWRAAWLAGATAVVSGQHKATFDKPIRSILDRVTTGFEAEARLTNLQLECSVSPSAALFGFDEGLGVIAVTGCVFATLSWLEGCSEPRIEVRADSPNQRTLKIEVVQRIKTLPADAARWLREPALAMSGDLTSAIGLRTLHALAVGHGGGADVAHISGCGSVIQSTFCKPAGN